MPSSPTQRHTVLLYPRGTSVTDGRTFREVQRGVSSIEGELQLRERVEILI